MVMKRNMMAKNLLQSIRKSVGRYIAIAVIIALGAAMFVGLRSTKMDMVATGQVYSEKQNMFDLRLISSYGWGREQVQKIAQLDGVVDAEGVFYTDLITERDDGDEAVYRFYTIPQKVNRLVLLEGRMPENKDECLADGFRNTSRAIGSTFLIAQNNDEDTLEKLTVREFTVVGIVSTPLYMDMNRGSTSVGSGSISNYYFVPEDAFNVDYYSEIHVTIPGEYDIYSDAYNDALSDAADALKPMLEPFARERLDAVRSDAEEAYRDGVKEYEDGVREYQEKKADVIREMDDAWAQLLEAEDTLRQSERQLVEGQQQLKEGRQSIRDGRKTIAQSRQTLATTRTQSFKELAETGSDYMEQTKSLNAERLQIQPELTQVSMELIQVNNQILQYEFGFSDASQEQIDQAYRRRKELENRQDALQGRMDYIDGQLSAMESAMVELAARQLLMEQQFTIAQDQLDAAESQLAVYLDELEYQEQVAAEGQIELEKGKTEFRDGMNKLVSGRLEAKKEFRKAEAELADAEQKLADARTAIDDLTKNEIYVLDRNTNMGYNSLDSASDIVAGVSKVFPVFFIAVAALVCITTMTRMVDEERTQIGTMKALGYSSGSIISKYLIYAGSSAVLGCFAGVALGSIVFPAILWEAYKIMIFITPRITLRFDWQLALVVILVYTASMLAVTWYCCARTLREVPAELIRPKAPAAGKKLLMERMAFWKNFSFLNKVAARNIFRYRQRLAMMLLGIGGCTALLMTGFGIRDSISKIVDIQFEEVTSYDMEVYFRGDCDDGMQQDFRKTVSPYAKDVFFFNQISGEISTDTQTRDIYLISATADIEQYMDFHSGKNKIEQPGVNEVLLSTGISDIMGISVGDSLIIRNPDMEELQLTVSGIYDNHVYNYAIIHPSTAEAQWGKTPDRNMAFVKVLEGKDAYAAGAAAAGAENVMNVTVSEQMADMVGTMMKALDLVVWVVVVCAGLLAIVVLYNLTNININERIREIATIKVLGFNAWETAMYVFKENLVLSIMGTVFGIPLGKLLLDFVISQIKIDMIWLKARLELQSLAVAVVLTVFSAFVVDIIFYFKLEKINMAEALKSVE